MQGGIIPAPRIGWVWGEGLGAGVDRGEGAGEGARWSRVWECRLRGKLRRGISLSRGASV
jgi:hypothetical protein